MKRILDLFSGAGGFSCGFQLARRGDHYIAVDAWLLALHTYQANIDNSEIIHVDVRNLDLSTIGKTDVLIGSPPCQTFTGANIKGNRSMDPRLVKAYLRIRDELRPRWWVMEESPFAAHLVEEPRFLNANDHGLFQARKRLFAGNYPEVIPGRHHKRIHPAIRAQEYKAYNGNMWHSPRAMSCCQWFGRRLASWELQVLMGFPSEYHFFGNYRDRCMQIGNAVCPPVSKAIYDAILEVDRS